MKIRIFSSILQFAILIMANNLHGQDYSKKWLSGYFKDIKGEMLIYHSPQPDANQSLLVRSIDRKRYIEWETEPIPVEHEGEYAEFIWLAAIDANREDSHNFDFYINNEKILTFSNPLDTLKKELLYKGQNGVELLFRAVLVDKYDDLMGYWFLKVPLSKYPKGDSLRLKVMGESAGSRSWFMVFKNLLESKIELYSEQALLRDLEQRKQAIRIDMIHLDDPARAVIHTGEDRIETDLRLGFNTVQLSVPAVREEIDLNVNIDIEGKDRIIKQFRLKPVRQWEVYLLHHSHVDIGYTHVQDEVRQIQWDHLEKAIAIAERSKEFPPEARFKWNSEVMWPVESYMRYAPPEKIESLLEAINNGTIGLDGMYANELTGICRPEELYRLFGYASEFHKKFGLKVESAMVTDIPGYTWGIVPAMAHNGIKYFSMGTNTGHRIGHVISEWGDRPFYWVSPSGQEKVLCLLEGKGYSMFHTGLGYTKLKKRLRERPVLDYLAELDTQNYPYDLVSLRYSIGSDNGPPDNLLPESVKEWNEKYLSPKIVISTTSQFFNELEKRHGDSIPAVKGDFTGHWEDGAYSTARESAKNRAAAERLVQAEILWILNDIEDYPHGRFKEAWRNVLLYDEHTWGSWNSISEPHSEFTQQQWETKKQFALNAEKMSEDLIISATGARRFENIIDVFNTNSWTRDDIIILSEEMSVTGDIIKDENGDTLPTQRLTSGELAVKVKNVPGLGTKRLYIEKGKAEKGKGREVSGNTIINGKYELVVDKKTGNISSISDLSKGMQYIDKSKELEFNGYYYIPGRDPKKIESVSNVRISRGEKGPLIHSMLIESDAAGAESLKREIRLFEGFDRIDIINTIDKIDMYDPEGVHFAYPFNIPDGQIRVDLAWGVYRPEYDQLMGSCKNYFTAQRWVDVSNQDLGITMALIDAPLIEIGEITADPIVVGWKKKVEESATIISYVMNNYWETNYKASQGGKAVFRYSFLPHGQFNQAEAKRFGIERSQPLIVIPSNRNSPLHARFVSLSNQNVIVTSMKPEIDANELQLRLYNISGKPEKTNIDWFGPEIEGIFEYDQISQNMSAIKGDIYFNANAIKTIVVKFSK